jgi:hypothetical protein
MTKDVTMRELTATELDQVAGGTPGIVVARNTIAANVGTIGSAAAAQTVKVGGALFSVGNGDGNVNLALGLNLPTIVIPGG